MHELARSWSAGPCTMFVQHAPEMLAVRTYKLVGSNNLTRLQTPG